MNHDWIVGPFTTTTTGAVDKQITGRNFGNVGRKTKEGKHVRDRERKFKSVGVRVGTVGRMTDKGRELDEMMQRRAVKVLCVCVCV